MIKLPFEYRLLSGLELEELIEGAFTEGYDFGIESGEVDSLDRIDALEKAIKRKNQELSNTRHELRLKSELVKVLEEERDDIREIAKQKVSNEDLAVLLAGKKESLDEREKMMSSMEASAYERGYTDGAKDGPRRAREATQG